ncbi:MAG: aspartate aminotransferase family protein [Planctomycetales bacterium]|nr:aspartate aminotransferase family protein [Planctomycetales bacterium]
MTPQLPPTDHRPAAYHGPTREETLALRQTYLTPGLLTYYREPLMIVEGHMQYVYDERGTRYLDAFAGIVTVSVGHCHPKVVEKVRAQHGALQHVTTIYLHPTIGELGKALVDKLPAGVDKVYFTNSGSEANEAAILAAREFTGSTDVVALRNCYHGGTSLPMSLTAHGNWRFPSNPALNVHHAHAGYCYRCPYNLSYPSCDLRCAHDIEETLAYQTSGQVACFIAEPIQGVGGVVVPPKEYFQVVYDAVRRHGGLCIADEVQGGFGRTGEHYWSHEHWGVVPDIVTMAKGLGNGAPIGAMAARAEVSATLARKVYFNTFGGNPVSVTQGLATLEVIEEEGVQAHAARVGAALKEGLESLADKYPVIGEVRGLGLMLGVELVECRTSKRPATQLAADVVERCKAKGLLIGKGGLWGQTLRIKPPMCLSLDDAQFIIDCLDETLAETPVTT